MKRAVIFDFGGVLVKTLDQSARHAWDDRLGLARGSVERIVHGSEAWREAQLGRLSVADYWAAVAHQLHLSDAEVRQLAEDYFSRDALDSALIDFIRQLRAAGHAVALLSNDSPALMDKLRLLGIADLFDPIIISANIGVMKPDARAYQAVLDALRIPPGQAVFIDDIPANVSGAQVLGIHAVHYMAGMNLAETLKPLLAE